MPKSRSKRIESKTDSLPNNETKSSSRKKIPDKCLRCALLSIQEVYATHGVDGDRCYDPQVCRSRRSYARHHMRRNEERRVNRQYTKQTNLTNTDQVSKAKFSAILHIYRQGYYQAPIDGISVEVRQGKSRVAVIPPIYCGGMTPKHIYACMEEILLLLQQEYKIEKFSSYVHLPPRDWQIAKRSTKAIREIPFQKTGLTDLRSAILITYRDSKNQSVYGIAAEVWQGSKVEFVVPPISCVYLTSIQVHSYVTKILQILSAQYGIRKFASQHQLAIESYPQLLNLEQESIEDVQEPLSSLNLHPLWNQLESVLQASQTPPLDYIAKGINDIVEEFIRFAELIFEELQATAVSNGPIMPLDAFTPYVRQFMMIDIQPFIEPPAVLPRKTPESRQSAEQGSSVELIDKDMLLEILQEIVLDEEITYEQPLAVAHSENVEGWIRVISDYLAKTSTSIVSFQEIVQSADFTAIDQETHVHPNSSIIKTWLALLLGGYALESSGDFYRGNVWVKQPNIQN